MNILVFSGFVGTGKTSLILSLARYLAAGAAAGSRELVIVENEIGEAGVDDQVLSAGGFEVRELFAGCVCCQLSTDLTLMLNELAGTLAPRWVIVEATGLAYPGAIASTLRDYGRGIDRLSIVTVVDAERWAELAEVAPTLVERQVADADVLIVNKIDTGTPADMRRVCAAVAAVNAGAPIFAVSATGEVPNDMWNAVTAIVDGEVRQ